MRWPPRSMAASVAMGLAKAFPLRVDQVGGDAQGPSFVAFGDEGEEHLGLARLGQVAQVVQGSPRSCHAGSLDSLRSRWRCRRGGLGGIHSGTGSKTSEQSRERRAALPVWHCAGSPAHTNPALSDKSDVPLSKHKRFKII